MHCEGVAEEVRRDDRTARPGLDDVLGALVVLDVHLLLQVVVDERALGDTAWHSLRISLSALIAGPTTAHDELVALLARAAGAALELTPGRDRVATTGRLALATTVGVVVRVHDHAADLGALALPPHAAGLAPADVRLLRVADLTDGGAAAGVDVADLAGGHAQLRIGAFLGDQLHGGAGAAGDLRAAAGAELDRVHDGAQRDVAQRQVVAGLDVRPGTVLDPVALTQLGRREDVPLLAVQVVQQRDAGGAVGVVLDVSDLGAHAVLVVTTEVDHAVGPLVAAAPVTGRDATVVVATAGLGQRTDQRLLRRGPGDLDEVGATRAATTGRGRLALTNCHVGFPQTLFGSSDIGRLRRPTLRRCRWLRQSG